MGRLSKQMCLMLDVDGVLITGRPSDGQPWTMTLEQDLGIAPRELVEQFFHKDWQDVVTGKRALRPTLEAALQRIGTPVSAQELMSYWFAMDARIDAQVLADCRALRQDGLQVFLTTNQEHERAHYLMHALDLQSEVDGILYSAQAGVQKPDPAFYAFARQMTGQPPSAHVFVDDTKANVQAARSAGWHAVHWTNTERLHDIVAKAVAFRP